MSKKLIKIGIFLISISLCILGYKNKELITSGQLLDSIIPTSIDDDYKKIENSLDEYKNDVKVFYDSLDYYYDNFIRKNRAMTTYLSNVEKDIEKIETLFLRINDKCNSSSKNDTCTKYKELLTDFVDVYNKIVIDYNNVLDSFNEFARSNFREEHIVENYKSILSSEILEIYSKIKTNQVMPK